MRTLLLIAWAATAALYDWRQQRLPNWLTLGGLGIGLIWIWMSGSVLLGGDPSRNGLAAGIAAAVLLPAYLAGWLGAGDVKFVAAMGILGGAAVLLPTLLMACIVAGFGALLVLVREGRGRGRRIPFGVGLALGFILVVEVL